MTTISYRVFIIALVMMMALSEIVVAGDLLRYRCFSGWGGQTRAGSSSAIDYASRDWDANRTYRQLVVLVSFSDCDFSLEDPKSAYDAMLNMPGYTQRDGAGYVADCFRDQSNGVFNLQFDVYNKGGQEHCAISAHLFYSQ